MRDAMEMRGVRTAPYAAIRADALARFTRMAASAAPINTGATDPLNFGMPQILVAGFLPMAELPQLRKHILRGRNATGSANS